MSLNGAIKASEDIYLNWKQNILFGALDFPVGTFLHRCREQTGASDGIAFFLRAPEMRLGSSFLGPRDGCFEDDTRYLEGFISDATGRRRRYLQVELAQREWQLRSEL